MAGVEVRLVRWQPSGEEFVVLLDLWPSQQPFAIKHTGGRRTFGYPISLGSGPWLDVGRVLGGFGRGDGDEVRADFAFGLLAAKVNYFGEY